MPAGVSDRLLAQVRERGVTPLTVDVSEFLKKGGGSVKCMIGDLGAGGGGRSPLRGGSRRASTEPFPDLAPECSFLFLCPSCSYARRRSAQVAPSSASAVASTNLGASDIDGTGMTAAGTL